MEITIRSVEDSDFSQIVGLIKDFAAFENHSDLMTNSVERMIEEKEFLNCFVAVTSDEKIVGYVTYFFSYYTWIGKSLYMDDLYVSPEYRSNGIGTKLINKVIQFAKETNCRKLRWQVSEWNKPAIEFYTKIGATIDNAEQNCDLILR